MKKISILSIVVLVVLTSFYSCKKDTQNPRIFFVEDVVTPQEWILQESYTLPKATASDNVDGDLTDNIVITNDLDFYEDREDSLGKPIYKLENKIKNGTEGYVGKTGDFKIVYTATDEEGNSGSKDFNVKVVNSLDDWGYNINGDKINYLVERKNVGSCNIPVGLEYDFADEISTSLKPDRKVNYKAKISKIADITGLGLRVDFNRFSRAITFDPISVAVSDEEAYKISNPYHSSPEDGHNEYRSEDMSFTVTYDVVKYKASATGQTLPEFDVDGVTWTIVTSCTYKETYVRE